MTIELQCDTLAATTDMVAALSIQLSLHVQKSPIYRCDGLAGEFTIHGHLVKYTVKEKRNG